MGGGGRGSRCNNNILSNCKAQNLVYRDYSKCARARARAHTHTHTGTRTHTHTRTRTRTHTHLHTHTQTHTRTPPPTPHPPPHTYTQAPEHTSILTIQKLNLHSLKRAANRDLRWMKTAARNRKHGRSIVYSLQVYGLLLLLSTYVLTPGEDRFLSKALVFHCSLCFVV